MSMDTELERECMALRAERDALAARLAELEGQEPVAWLYDWQAPEGLIKGWVETNRDAIPEDATNIRPLYARPIPAEPVNARLLEALKRLSFCAQTTGGVAGRDDELCSAIEASAKAIAEAEAQQERLLQDMHDAGREIDRVMAVDAETVDRAWARFCGSFGDGPDAPYPGMIAAFETHYGQSFRDKAWRTEAACWAAAWHRAIAQTARAEPVRLTDEEVVDFVDAINVDEDKHCHMTVSNGNEVVLAIESAVLRSNGFKVEG